MNQNELNEILRKHKMWLNNENGGERADLSDADLSFANLIGADLIRANLIGANLSGATGLMQQWEFVKNNFESTADGIIAYKTFGDTYIFPEKWKIEKGSVIAENVNFTRTDDCCCGINVAPLEWVKKYHKGQIWKVLIRWEWLAGVCVPYNSEGKIRCECVELLCVVDENIEKEQDNEKGA